MKLVEIRPAVVTRELRWERPQGRTGGEMGTLPTFIASRHRRTKAKRPLSEMSMVCDFKPFGIKSRMVMVSRHFSSSSNFPTASEMSLSPRAAQTSTATNHGSGLTPYPFHRHSTKPTKFDMAKGLCQCNFFIKPKA